MKTNDSKTRAGVVAMLSACIAMSGAPAHGQDTLDSGSAALYEAPDYISVPAPLPPHMIDGPVWRLGLEDAIKIAIEENLGIALQKQDLTSTRELENLGLALWDPVLTAAYVHRDSISPPQTRQEGEAGGLFRSQGDTWSVGVQKTFSTATQLRLDFGNSFSRSSLGTAVLPNQDIFRSSLDLTLTQPLLRGFSWDRGVPMAGVLSARIATQKALLQTQVVAAAAVRAVEGAYWDLVETLKGYQVQQSSLDLAKEQLALTQRQIDAGVLAPSDLISAEGTLARRELDLVQAEASIARAMDQLRAIMNVPAKDWVKPIAVVNAPGFHPIAADSQQLLKVAQDKRPELSQLGLDLQTAALDLKVAQNNRLPQLDASLTYGLQGQSDTYAAATDGVAGTEARRWFASINFSWPVFGRAAAAQERRAQSSRSRVYLSREQSIQNIRLQVRDAARGLNAAARQVRAAGRFRYLALANLDVEQRKFLAGTSSNFIVAQRQEELSQARLAELSAIIRHEKALADVKLASGEILEHRHVVLTLR